MKSIAKRMVCLAIVLGMNAALAQQNTMTDKADAAATSTPVAYVYVSTNHNGGSGANQITGFAAAADGRLTPLAGSPYAGDVTGMVLNGKYLFGFNKDAVYEIDSFAMASDGALKQVAATDGQSNDPAAAGCNAPAAITLDHTGQNLYAPVDAGDLCDNMEYQSYTVVGASGKLDYMGSSGQSFLYNWPLTITANNKFAYGADCIDYEGGTLSEFQGYERKSNGTLESGSFNMPIPAIGGTGLFYCPSITAADTTDLLAVGMIAVNSETGQMEGPSQIAGYTVDTQGNLHTTSTYENMPPTEVGPIGEMSMAPSGLLLAVGGSNGLQVFHFGIKGISRATGLLTTDGIGRVDSAAGLVFWDNDNHLYAISPQTGKLHVFTVTESSAAEAAGSPYTLSMPQNMALLPRTK
jgi:hypothetical protein